MTILFTCPHCGTQTDVYDEYAGRSGPCAICGKTITIPYPSMVGEASGSASPEERTARPRHRVASSTVLRVVLIVGAAITASTVLLVLLFALVFPAVSSARRSAQKSKSAENMRKLALAMLAYEADHGRFPPAYIADDKGRPMHSWRVLLLPYLGYDHLYDKYDFDVPWDDPKNMEILSWMPEVFACPADPDAIVASETSYMVIVGDHSMFPGADSVTRLDVTDGLDRTIMLVQTPASGVCWLEPRDLDMDQMQFVVNGRPGFEIGSHLPGGAWVATANGKTHFVPNATLPQVVHDLVTIDGGELIPDNLPQ